jgi:hypothetical protein
MDKIVNHSREIVKLNTRVESAINETISKKYYDIGSISDIVCELGRQGESVSLSREDIFNESDTRKRIVKALIWGYPNDVRNTPGVIENLDNIVAFVNAYKQNKDGHHLLIELLGTDRMGLSTASKLLYFFDVCFDGAPAVIIDNVVNEGLTLFEEFRGLPYISNAKNYILGVKAINEVRNRLNSIIDDNLIIECEDVEYYLFRIGQQWIQYERQQIIELKNRDNYVLFQEFLNNHGI